MLHQFTVLLFALAAGFFLSGCAQIMTMPCDKARISNLVAPSAYVVKLPFALDDSLPPNGPATRVDTLLDLQTIVLASGIEGTHVTLLQRPTQGECEITQVYDSVTKNHSRIFWRRLFNSAVFVWGDVFEDSGKLYVQVSMRVFWNGRDAVASVLDKSSPDEPPLEFTGRFPNATIVFKRRALDAHRVAEMANDLDKLQPRTKRDSDKGDRVSMPKRFIANSFDQSGLILLTTSDGEKLWLPRREIETVAEGLVPELEFVRAVVAYLHFKATHSARSARTSVEALQRFERYSDKSSTSAMLPLAIADLIRGNLNEARHVEQSTDPQRGLLAAIFGGAPDPSTTLAAQLQIASLDESEAPETNYKSAGMRMPDDSDVLTLSALALIPECCKEGPQAAQRIDYITKALSNARQIEITSTQAARNLLNWYRRLARVDPALRSISTDVLVQRTEALERALAP